MKKTFAHGTQVVRQNGTAAPKRTDVKDGDRAVILFEDRLRGINVYRDTK